MSYYFSEHARLNPKVHDTGKGVGMKTYLNELKYFKNRSLCRVFLKRLGDFGSMKHRAKFNGLDLDLFLLGMHNMVCFCKFGELIIGSKCLV